MGISQEMLGHKRMFPVKPKKNESSIDFSKYINPKPLQKKPDLIPEMNMPTNTPNWDELLANTSSFLGDDTSMGDFFGLGDVDHQMVFDDNQSTLDDDVVLEASHDLWSPVVTQPTPEAYSDTWENLANSTCISQAQAEGMDQVYEFMVPTDAKVTIMDDSNNETTLVTPTIKRDYSLSALVSPEPNFLCDPDLLEQSLQQSGVIYMDSIIKDIIVAPVTLDIPGITCIPEPVPTTSTFIKTGLLEPFSTKPPLETIDYAKLGIQSPSRITIIEDNTKEEEDPDWTPLDDWNVAKTPVYAKKSIIHTVQKPGMKKRKPGRPARQENYTITEVPPKKSLFKSDYSEEEIQGLKYRRMRDLNNKASQECRARRKNKQVDIEMEKVHLEEKNKELKRRLAKMEMIVARLRELTNQQ